MGELVCFAAKRAAKENEERLREHERNIFICNAIDAIVRAMGDPNLSHDETVAFVFKIGQMIKRNGGISVPLSGEEGESARYKKLMDLGYIERSDPFEWIVDEPFLGFRVGDSLGMVQSLVLRKQGA